MKIVFTTVFLFFCLKLSAVAPHILLPKPAAEALVPQQDTSKTKAAKDSGKTAATAQKQDTIKVIAAINPSSDINQPASVSKTDSVVTTLRVVEPDKSKQNWFYTLPAVTFVNAVAPPVEAEAPEPVDNNPPIISMIQLDSLKNAVILEHIQEENLRKLILRNEQIKLARILQINNLDSLKLELKTATIDTLKGLLYSRIAQKYMDDDTLSEATKRLHAQNAAINYTLLAIHEYSLYNDSVGLRDSYTNLSKVYYAQRKYTEAKWFILQSNTLSRARKDTPNIISTLIKLAAIKSEIKDYTLAMGDLNEALQLSIDNHTPQTELEILKSYALLYSNMQDYPKEEMVLKKRDALLDSLHKAEEAELAKAAALKKKQDALNKKKQYLASLKKPSKTASPAKVASL